MKLYVVVRSDLPPGAMIAQACHGMRAFATAFPEEERLWYASSNNLVVLTVGSEDVLSQLEGKLREESINCVSFREPDFDGARTALAVSPSGAKALSNLPLALRGVE